MQIQKARHCIVTLFNMMNNNFRPLTATSPVASPTILATAGEKKKPGLLESIVLGGASCVFTVNVS